MHPCKEILETMTSQPGVYQMFNSSHKIIYVGKAKNLKNRLQSYFREQGLPIKTQVLMQNVCSIEVVITSSEAAALILEANLIKRHRPKYNILLRDDKSYPYLRLDDSVDFPRIDIYRGNRSQPGKYFGPYPDAGSVRDVLNLLQTVFRIRQCGDHFFNHRSRPCLQYQINRCTAPCVGYVNKDDYALQVERAVALLSGKDSELIADIETAMSKAAQNKEYELAANLRDQIAMLRSIQAGSLAEAKFVSLDIICADVVANKLVVCILLIRNGRLLGQRSVTAKCHLDDNLSLALPIFLMQYYAADVPLGLPQSILIMHTLADKNVLQTALRQETAAKKLLIKTCLSSSDDQLAKWLATAKSNALHAANAIKLAADNYEIGFAALPDELQLDSAPNFITCFDISHTQGEATVASCVVCSAEGLQRRDYRRLNIKNVTAGDDYAAMAQAVQRYMQNLKEKNKPLPDLLLIDGGKGQLSAVQAALLEIQVSDVALCAIAKGRERKAGQERFFMPGRDVFRLQSDSKCFLMLQEIRNEAHRYAITGHRRQRNARRVYSSLETIPGVGEKTRQKLLTHFGGLQGVKSAAATDLEAVPGISKIMAAKIYNALHGG
jgi:excinuclease ABC subunit C